MRVLVYNNVSGRMETHYRELSEPMPYITGKTLSVREFRARSASNVIWTDRRAMEAWSTTRAAWGMPIYVGYAFRRIGEGGHSAQSQHYAGMAFDVAQNIGNEARDALRRLAERLNVWRYVEPAYLTPTWVHFDARLSPPACSAGYPMLREGNHGVYTCTLQDALSTVKIPVSAIDGIFGQNTKDAVIRFQRANGLTPDGIVGCATWNRLTTMANGITRSGNFPPTYINW